MLQAMRDNRPRRHCSKRCVLRVHVLGGAWPRRGSVATDGMPRHHCPERQDWHTANPKHYGTGGSNGTCCGRERRDSGTSRDSRGSIRAHSLSTVGNRRCESPRKRRTRHPNPKWTAANAHSPGWYSRRERVILRGRVDSKHNWIVNGTRRPSSTHHVGLRCL